MRNWCKKIVGADANELARSQWLKKTLTAIPSGMTILDAGAGELRNKSLCAHLHYVSQDVCQYEGRGNSKGLHMGNWNTQEIDLVSDITQIPAETASFDRILCSEVFEHLPDPLLALEEFSRLLRPGGQLIITAPFASLVHFAPYFFATGFSSYWYEHHLPIRGFRVEELQPNGDWFSYLRQELLRLPKMVKNSGSILWPLAYLVSAFGSIYLALLRRTTKTSEIACFGWHCVATKI